MGMAQGKRFGWMWWAGCGCLAIATLGGGYHLARGPAIAAASADDTDPAPRRSAAVRLEVVHPRKGGVERTTVQPGSVHSFETV
jgi:HlyD family secretion protein